MFGLRFKPLKLNNSRLAYENLIWRQDRNMESNIIKQNLLEVEELIHVLKPHSIPKSRAITWRKKQKGLFSTMRTQQDREWSCYISIHITITIIPHTNYLFYSASFSLPKSMLLLYLWPFCFYYFSSSIWTPQVPIVQLATCKLHQFLQGLYSDPTCTATSFIRLMSFTNMITFA